MGELESNVGVVRRLMKAFGERDDGVVLDLVHPDIEWVPPASAADEPYRGIDGIRRYLAEAEERPRVEPTEVRASGDTVVLHARGEPAKSLTLVWRVRDGRAASVRVAQPDTALAQPAAPTPFLIELPAVPESVPLARDAVTEWASRLDPESTDLLPLQICASEATTNVVLHAYVGMPPGRLRVATSTSDGQITMVVEDDGRGMVPHPDSPGLGMGLPLMGRMAASLGIVSAPERPRGCRVQMRFHLAGSVEQAAEPTPAGSSRS